MIKTENNSIIMKEEITCDSKYNELFVIFEKLFRRHGYFLKDNFDSNVWFLKNDSTFKSLLLNQKNKSLVNNKNQLNSMSMNTPIKSNKVCDIVFFLNENKTKNSDSISINVKVFIYKICEQLLECNKIISRSEDTIKMYNAHQKVHMINENLKILQERNQKKYNEEFSSKLNLFLLQLNNFPIGEYEFEVKVLEFTPTKIDLNGKNVLSPTTSNSMINNKTLKLHETIKFSSYNNTNTFKYSDYGFDTFEFKIFENKMFEDLFKHHSHSGTTFSNFKLKCFRKNKNEVFESKVEYFLDIMLIYIEDIYDLSKDTISKTLHFKLQNKILEKEQEDECVAVIIFTLQLDDLTRSGILKRVYDIFQGVITTKRMSEEIIDEVLDEYFSDVSETIKNILYKKLEEKREPCCNCLIY